MNPKKRQQELEDYYTELINSELEGKADFFMFPREELFGECHYRTRLVLDELIQLRIEFEALREMFLKKEKNDGKANV